MEKVLLTGFEPFDGEPINPSLEAVKDLHGEVIEGHEIISHGPQSLLGNQKRS